MQGKTHTTSKGVTRKEEGKDEKHKIRKAD